MQHAEGSARTVAGWLICFLLLVMVTTQACTDPVSEHEEAVLGQQETSQQNRSTGENGADGNGAGVGNEAGGGAGGTDGGGDHGRDGDKVVICHVPPGNPGNAHTITVGADAVADHLAHGDHEGVCDDTSDEDESGDEEGDDDSDENSDKVVICHVPPGNPGNAHTITVGADAVADHLAHGDHEGACQDTSGDGNGEDHGRDGDKVVICHVPPGNPGNAHTITVSADAVADHLAHGDHEGACQDASGDEGGGDDSGGDDDGDAGGSDGGGGESSGLAGSVPDPNNSRKVIICHVPPGNSANAHTLSINRSALAGHASHSDDYDGPCNDNGRGGG